MKEEGESVRYDRESPRAGFRRSVKVFSTSEISTSIKDVYASTSSKSQTFDPPLHLAIMGRLAYTAGGSTAALTVVGLCSSSH